MEMLTEKSEPRDSLNRLLAKRERLLTSVIEKTRDHEPSFEIKREIDEIDLAIEELIRGKYRLG
jgi:hypothetical protein